MENKLCFVQFIHPGGEAIPLNGSVVGWNQGDHKRKFLLQEGLYLKNNEVKADKLMFWGEWEAQSNTRSVFSREINGPNYFHEPFYNLADLGGPGECGSKGSYQNTDPFVFGRQILYSNCKQLGRSGNSHQLRYLKPGSVILFGSHVRQCFVLDTVFVVESSIDYGSNFRETLAGRVDEESLEVSLSRLKYFQNMPYRLYFGATYKNPFHGMFSYFPTRPFVADSKGFARPKITLDGIVTQSLKQGQRYNFDEVHNDLNKVRSLWENVVKQVESQGLALGIAAQMPEKKETPAL